MTGGGAATGGGTGGGATGGGTGGGATGGGSGGGGATGGGGTQTFFDFDGGWQIQIPPRNPALVGDGGVTTVIGMGADAMSPTKFGGTVNSSAGINVVYPPNGVMLPPNTNAIEFHFIPAAGQTLFRFTFTAPTTTLVVYTGCTAVGGGCVFTPDATFWSNLVAYARGLVPVTWTVTGVNGSSPGQVGNSLPQSIQFTEEDMVGGLYYWNSGGTLERFDYGFPNSPRQTYLTGANVGGVCLGCHVISRDGNLLAVGKNIPSPAAYDVLNVPTKTRINSMQGPVAGSANYFSFAPDEQHLLQSNGLSIEWLRLVSGVSTPVTNPGTMPDWSPNGRKMVFARPGGVIIPFPTPSVGSASLQTMNFNGSGFDPPVMLVPFNGQNNYYPTYSPDGLFVLFNRSPSNKDSFSNGGPDQNDGGLPDGELWTVSANGGTPVRLTNASAPTGAASWPKWAPVRHTYSGGHVMWLTFSSWRAYGLRLADWQRSQLWMVAFDPTKVGNGLDPSFPAFWLPFQDIGSGNHIGQWSVQVPRANCVGSGQSTCASGEVCQNGKCRPG